MFPLDSIQTLAPLSFETFASCVVVVSQLDMYSMHCCSSPVLVLRLDVWCFVLYSRSWRNLFLSEYCVRLASYFLFSRFSAADDGEHCCTEIGPCVPVIDGRISIPSDSIQDSLIAQLLQSLQTTPIRIARSMMHASLNVRAIANGLRTALPSRSTNLTASLFTLFFKPSCLYD